MGMLERVELYAIKQLTTEVTAHDFSHSLRVMKLAKYIGENIGQDVDLEIISVAALTHDIIDKKVVNDVDKAVKMLSDELLEIGYGVDQVKHILGIIQNMSYSSGKTPDTLEGKIVQDADRLEAVGAIAIARTFAYGGKLNRTIYSEEDSESGIAHFYDKLLLLKDKMHTEIAKSIAESRHQFMLDFLSQFYKEWNLEDIN